MLLLKRFWIPTVFAFIVFLLGWEAGEYLHPYEQCTRKGFTNPEDIGECIWLLDNQPALR